jgi:hypothetical protein
MRKAAGVAAASAAVALIGAGAGVSVAAPHASHAANPTMPTIKVTASKSSFKVSGSTTFTPGRVELVLKGVGPKDKSTDIISLKGKYTFKDLRADFKAFGKKEGTGPHGSTPKSALKHLNHAINHVDFYGGLDVFGTQKEHATMVLPKAGDYILFNNTHKLPKNPHTLTAAGTKVDRAAPASSATVNAVTKRRFTGSKTLPANGTVTFKNKSTESPHFLGLLHVKKGTSRKQVLAAFQGSGPNVFRNGQAATDVVDEGNSMTLSYKVPAGTYAEVCFFPDPKTGMPHAFMGMVRIVKLK